MRDKLFRDVQNSFLSIASHYCLLYVGELHLTENSEIFILRCGQKVWSYMLSINLKPILGRIHF